MVNFIGHLDSVLTNVAGWQNLVTFGLPLNYFCEVYFDDLIFLSEGIDVIYQFLLLSLCMNLPPANHIENTFYGKKYNTLNPVHVREWNNNVTGSGYAS